MALGKCSSIESIMAHGPTQKGLMQKRLLTVSRQADLPEISRVWSSRSAVDARSIQQEKRINSLGPFLLYHHFLAVYGLLPYRIRRPCLIQRDQPTQVHSRGIPVKTTLGRTSSIMSSTRRGYRAAVTPTHRRMFRLLLSQPVAAQHTRRHYLGRTWSVGCASDREGLPAIPGGYHLIIHTEILLYQR